MQHFVSDERRKMFIQTMRENRLEQNIMMVRRKAIWAGRNPDLAEHYYRAKVAENELKRQNR